MMTSYQIEGGRFALLTFSPKQKETIKQDLRGITFELNEGT